MCGNKWFRILKQVEMESCMNILDRSKPVLNKKMLKQAFFDTFMVAGVVGHYQFDKF